MSSQPSPSVGLGLVGAARQIIGCHLDAGRVLVTSTVPYTLANITANSECK